MSNPIFISLGGHCEIAGSIQMFGLREHALPFDYVRSSFEGVIECIQNDFTTFFPKTVRKEQIGVWTAFRGKNVGFFHHDLLNPEILNTFKRRIQRFGEILYGKDKVIFVRSIASQHVKDEINLNKQFHDIMKIKYPHLEYILCFVILNQKSTRHVLTIDESTVVFTTVPHTTSDLSKIHVPVFRYLKLHHTRLPNLTLYDYSNIQNIDMRVEGVEPLDPDN